MGYTQQQLADLQAAYATGATKIRYSDGREMVFRDSKQMRALIDEIKAELGMKSAPRTIILEHTR